MKHGHARNVAVAAAADIVEVAGTGVEEAVVVVVVDIADGVKGWSYSTIKEKERVT
jgi:hypothetical protein